MFKSIVAAYQSLLRSDPDLTMPVAAIEALVSLLASAPSLTTISEILDLLASSVATLKRSISNPISLSAGTDLFQRYLITTLQRGGPTSTSGQPSSHGAAGDFQAIRAHLLSNGRLFVARAKDARRAIAAIARRFIREESTVLTNGGSRVVDAVLRAAAESQTRETGVPRFRVIYVYGSSGTSMADVEGAGTIAALRALHVPVATIPEAAVAYSMGKVSMVLVGAEGVVENGGIISRMGTYQVGILAKAAGKPVYVVAESHKFVRMFPLGQYDLGFDQNVLDFTTDNGKTGSAGPGGLLSGVETPKAEKSAWKQDWGEMTPVVKNPPEYFYEDGERRWASGDDGGTTPGATRHGVYTSTTAAAGAVSTTDTVDFTPPDLITAIVTEAGVMTPSAVSEELIKIWY